MVEFIIASILPWTIVAIFTILVLVCILNTVNLLRFIKRNLLVSALLVAIIMLGAYLRFNHSPSTHRTYYDEDRYLSYAVTFARFNQARDIEFATPEKIVLGKPDRVARVTVPVVHGLVLKFFGYTENNLFVASKLFSLLQIILLFSVALLIYKNSAIAILAAFLMAVLPSSVFWATSTVLDPYFLTFSLLALMGGLLYARKSNNMNVFLSIITLVPLLFTRLEAALFIGIIALCGLAIRRHEGMKLFTKKDAIWLAAIIIIVGSRAIISLSLIGQTWCCGESTPLETFRAPFFIRHLLLNLGNLFLLAEVPWIIFVLSLGTLMAKKDLRNLVLGIWFITFFILYSSYYAGRFFDYQFSGSYGRFFLILIPPLLLLASSASIEIFSTLKKKGFKNGLPLFIASFLLLVVGIYPTALKYKKMIATSPYYAVVERKPEEFHDYWDKSVLKKIPPNAVVIHSLTGLVLLHGHPAIYYASMYDNKTTAKYIVRSLKKGVAVYSLPEYICGDLPHKCRYFNNDVEFTYVPESTKSAELSYMKLKLKKKPSTNSGL